MGIDTHDQQLNALIEAGLPMEAFERRSLNGPSRIEGPTVARFGTRKSRSDAGRTDGS